jgi:hypothetical protein
MSFVKISLVRTCTSLYTFLTAFNFLAPSRVHIILSKTIVGYFVTYVLMNSTII